LRRFSGRGDARRRGYQHIFQLMHFACDDITTA
jgi:hypothetical protein